MAREFTAASSHKIVFALGNLGFAFGPGTAAGIIRPTSTAISNPTVLSSGAANAQSWMLQVLTGGAIAIRLDGTTSQGTTAVSANNWYLIAVAKASGSAKARIHIYPYGTGTWVHEDATVARANSSVPVTQAQIGCTPAGASFFGGAIAVCGAWNVVLTDTQVEALAFDLQAWFQAQPRGLFVLDQAATSMSVNDLSGGGANQSSITGTAVSTNSVPVFSYGYALAGNL